MIPLRLSDLPAITASRVLYETGMRPKTLFSLKNRQLDYRTGVLKFVEAKTQTARTVKISRELSILLTKFFKTYHRFQKCFRNTDRLRKALASRIPRIDIQKPHLNKLYLFRYLYIYNAIKSGRSPEDVRLDLGHSDIVYTNNYIDIATKAIEKLP